MQRIFPVLIAGMALNLVGCGGSEFDGNYIHKRGTEYRMKVDGDQVFVTYLATSE